MIFSLFRFVFFDLKDNQRRYDSIGKQLEKTKKAAKKRKISAV